MTGGELRIDSDRPPAGFQRFIGSAGQAMDRSQAAPGGPPFGVHLKGLFVALRRGIELSVVGQGAPRPEQQEDDLVESEDGYVSWAKFSTNVKSCWEKYCTPQGRLMAERAARVVAMRRLAERIKGTYIDSRTKVSDFVTEEDVINMGLSTFLRGAKEIGVRYHSDDLIVEVEMQIKLKQVLATIHSFLKVKYSGDQMKLRKLQQTTTRTEIRIIKETGMGVPPEKYLRKAPLVVRQVAMMAKKAPMWATATKRAVGQGAIDTDATNPAQAKLMAYRAAELDARRKLAEEIEGLAITSNTSVKDFVTESDEIRTSMLSFQQGARVIDKSRKIEDGIAHVTVEIELKPLWNTVIFYKKKLGLTFR